MSHGRRTSRPRPSGALLIACWVGVSACNKQKPDFGTLPQVKVTLGRDPKPAPPPPAETETPGLAPADVTTDLPDPPPQRSADYVYYTFVFDHGTLRVEKAERVHLAQPASSDRRLGRFSFELWIGKELLDRIRFDFPLLAAETSQGENEFEQGLEAQTLVKVPLLTRATRAQVLDRKTREVLAVEWPPPEASGESHE